MLAGNRGFREIAGARVVTGADGGFVYRVPPGASRQVRIAYRAYSRDTDLRRAAAVQPAHAGRGPPDREAVARAQRRARDVPRAAARRPEAARRRPRRPAGARAGRPLPHLPDGPHQRKGGRFSTRYRFSRTTRTTGFRFRALVRKQIGYAYSTGSSPVRRVTVTPSAR